MSQFSPARASRRRVLTAGLAAVAATAGLSVTAQSASAAFSLTVCNGSNAAKNQGASFQNGAQTYWRTVFASSNGCNGAVVPQPYLSNGSGNGLASMGAGGGSTGSPFLNCAPTCGTANSGGGRTLPAGERDLTTAFASTDDPPSPTQQAAMNAGSASTATDDALVHVIPVATGATTIIARAPDGCELSTVTNLTGVTGDGTEDTATDKTKRIRIPNVLLEKAFAGATDADTWGEIAPGISGTPVVGGQNDGLSCANVPVKRIVRQDSSGTTFAFKAFLALINPSRGWLTTYNAPNTVWPASGGTGNASPVPTGPTPTGGTAPAGGAFCANTAANLLCSRSTSGNGGVAAAVNATQGSLGYNDLATSRTNGFEITPSATAQDYTFWLPVENNPGSTTASGLFFEPTSDPRAHKPNVGGRGANCGTVTVQNAPTVANSPKGDPTLGDWSRAFAAGGAGYSSCVLTYALAWDDSAPVYGNTAEEQGKARTVKDFLTRAVISAAGQQFTNVDYSPLPNPVNAPLLQFAQDGVAAIDWNKTSSGTNTPPVDNTTPPATSTTPPPTGGNNTTPPASVPPVVLAPSNVFTVSGGKVNAGRTKLTYLATVPGKGLLTAVATYKAGSKTVRITSQRAVPTGAGTVKLTVRLSSKARAALKKAKKLAVTVKFTYVPTGGTAATLTRTVTIRAKAAPRT